MMKIQTIIIIKMKIKIITTLRRSNKDLRIKVLCFLKCLK